MKHNIIKTDNYLLVVDESEIKVGDWYYVPRTNKAYKCQYDPTELEMEKRFGVRKVIAHLPLNFSPILEGVPLLPPIEDDVEQLAANYVTEDGKYGLADDADRELLSFTAGYNKAKEKYRFTEEDIAKAITYGWDLSHYHRLNTEEKLLKMQRDFIKSLSQPKMPIGFECEIVPKKEGTIMQIPPCKHCIKPKTTTTPEGHKEWMGTYIFN